MVSKQLDILGIDSILRKPTLPVHEPKTMFSVKSESCDAFEVGTESQGISIIDENPRISDTLDINISENPPDKNLGNELLMTVAYIKNESTSNTLHNDNLNSKANEGCLKRNLTDISVMKTEKTEGYTDNASGNVTNDEYDTVQAKETLLHYHIKGHDINRMADISQLYKIGDSDTVDMEDVCSSSATQAKAKTQKCALKIPHSGERRFMCDLCTYSARKLSDVKMCANHIYHTYRVSPLNVQVYVSSHLTIEMSPISLICISAILEYRRSDWYIGIYKKKTQNR